MSGDLFARYREEDRARNAALTLGAKKPEQAADIRRLSQKTGLPPGAVAQDPDSVRRQVERERLNNLQITSPLVAKWVTQPGNYDLAQDDIDALQAVEKGFGELYQARGKGTKDDPYAPDLVPLTPYDELSDVQRATLRDVETNPRYAPGVRERRYQALTDEQLFEAAPQGAYVRMADGTLRRRESGLMDALANFPRRGVNLLGSFVDLATNAARAVTPDMEADTLGGMVLAKPTGAPAIKGPERTADISFKDIRESETALDALVKLPEFVGEGLLFSAPDIAGAFVAMPVYIAARTEEIAQSRAKNDGRDAPDVADYAIASVAAQIEGRLERFATGRLPGLGTAAGKPLTRIAKETAVQAGTEGIEEFVPYAAETTGTVAGFNSMDALDATAGGAIIGGGLGLGVQGGKEAYRVADRSASGIIRRAVDIDAARGEKAVLDNLVTAVDTTKLKSLAPDKLEEAVDNIAAGTVFLPIGEVTTYFQSASLDPREAVADLTGSDTAYDEAVATGGEIAVPLGRYAARVKPEAHAVLGNTARLKPGQAIKPNAEMPDAAAIEADIRAAIAEAQTNPARADDASGEVYDAVFGQLVGNTDRTAANQYAATVQAFYGNMARRLGVTPMELYGQFRLNMLGNSQAKPVRVDGAMDPILDAIRAKRGFTDKEVKGPGLVSSLIAAGGIRPDSVGGANLKKMVDKGRVGLFNKDGMTLDEAVQWAKANGFAFDTATEASGLYDSDGFDINALSNLIEQDIRQGVYAAENLNEKRAGFNAAMDGVMQMLDEKGIDINAMSNAEIKALLEGDAQTLNQPADGGKADDNRGQVTIRKQADGTIDFDITLLKKANFSTFLHESGHVYLEIMRALALRDNAPADIKADWKKISDYLGVKPGDALTVDQHERWARSFEAYLREGKAPSKSLRAAFASFKLWLTRIYTSAKALNVELSDDIRGVMDRMLASEAEIQEAAKAQNLGALFKDRVAEDWDQAMFEEYARQVEAVQAEAEAEVAAKLLKAEQDAQQAWYKAELKALQEAVALELSREPVFVAQQILRNGRYGNGDPAPDSIKVALDKGDLLDNYGAEFLKRMKGLYRNEGGISADEAAVLFGFSTGRELVEALVNADSFGNAVKAEAQRRMDERHPDPMKDGTLPQQAMNALHSDKMGEVLVKEINLLEKRAGKPATTLQVMKEAARRMIGAKALKAVRPAQYLLAEQKAGREALEAAARQDWEAARVARRMQLLNHQLYRAATDAQAEAVKQHKFLRRFVDGDRRAEIGKASEEMLAGIDALLAGVDWRASATRDTGRGRPWRELTVADLKALHDEVKEAYHVATREGIIMDGDRKVQAAVVGQDMAQSVKDAHGEKPTQYGIETAGEKVTKGWHVVRALAGAATDLARELDGFKDGGAVWNNTVRKIHEAMNNRVLPALQKAQEREAQIFLKHYTKKELRRLSRDGRRINGVPGTWSKEQILALALNWGNQGNRDAVLGMVRKPLTPEQVAKLLGTLDARDWAFVQDIWDMIDAHWPEISDAAQRRKGLRPERVERMPFTVSTADGKVLAMRGGYYPLKGEADSAKTDMETVDDFYDAILTGSFSKASTKDGHTIERVGFGGRTVRLDLGVINQHQTEVIRDIHLGDAVNYVHQTLSNGDFTAAVEKAGMLEHQKALKAWLKDVAAGEMGLRSWHEKSMRALRTNFTASVLTFKLMSALIQITGVVQSSVVVGHRTMLAGIGRYAKNPMEAGRYVNEASNFMRLRGQTQIDAIEQAANARSSAYASGKATMLKWGYYMIGRVQRIVDLATWMAAENKGIELFGDDRAKVIAYADDVVKRAQGSGAFEDKNSVQRGTLGDNVRQSEHIRGFTVLMGYMMAKNNVVVERAAKARKQGGIKGAASMAVAMTELFVVEAMILAAIRGQWPEDEDEDGIFDDLLKYAASEGALGLIGGIPGISQFGSEIRGYDAKGILGNLFEEVANVNTQIDQGEADKALLKSVVNVAGLTTGVPSGQINKTIDALAAAEDGEDVALYQYVTGPEKK